MGFITRPVACGKTVKHQTSEMLVCRLHPNLPERSLDAASIEGSSRADRRTGLSSAWTSFMTEGRDGLAPPPVDFPKPPDLISKPSIRDHRL